MGLQMEVLTSALLHLLGTLSDDEHDAVMRRAAADAIAMGAGAIPSLLACLGRFSAVLMEDLADRDDEPPEQLLQRVVPRFVAGEEEGDD
jgi:hypothetical protein